MIEESHCAVFLQIFLLPVITDVRFSYVLLHSVPCNTLFCLKHMQKVPPQQDRKLDKGLPLENHGCRGLLEKFLVWKVRRTKSSLHGGERRFLVLGRGRTTMILGRRGRLLGELAINESQSEELKQAQRQGAKCSHIPMKVNSLTWTSFFSNGEIKAFTK